MQLQVLALARAALVLGPWALGAATAAIVTIDFEKLDGDPTTRPLAADDRSMVSYEEQGYQFTFLASPNPGTINPTGFGSWGSDSLNRPLGSSRALYNAGVQPDDAYGEPGFTILTRADGLAFDLLSIELSHYSNYVAEGNPAALITFTGTRADNSTTTATASVETFGFQPFAIGSLTNVVQVRWQQTATYAHQFDNLVLNQAQGGNPPSGVPEPGSLALAGLALAGLLGARRSRA